MAPTRILVADLPRMQREIVTELLVDRADVVTIEAGGAADVVILGRDDPALARELLEASPRLIVLSLTDGELTAWRYGLTPYREPLGELSPAALTAGIEPRDPLPPWWTS